MKYCPACHAENEDTARFCLVCGHLLSGKETPSEGPDAEKEPAEEAREAAEPAAPDAAEEPRGEEEASAEETFEETVIEEPAKEETPEPGKGAGEAAPAKSGLLTTGQYFLLEALFAIPVIGTVCLFVFSLSRPKNESLRRFSSSVLIWRLILYILVFAGFAVILVSFKTWVPKIAGFIDSVEKELMH